MLLNAGGRDDLRPEACDRKIFGCLDVPQGRQVSMKADAIRPVTLKRA